MSLHFPTAEAFAQQFQSNKDWLQEKAISILKKGKIPRHVGIILDGNRRFAKKLGATNTLTGHFEGYKRLTKVKIKLWK
jgi:ditrans,polycis-polyprenyl diphosphate synthase